MDRSGVRNLIDRLGAAEDGFRGRQFLAPAINGSSVNLRIGQVICKMKVAPAEFRGFGIFESISYTEAILVRNADLRERQNYLRLFPALSLIATCKTKEGWLGSLAQKGDHRFQLTGLAPIQLTENVNLFDVVECRFDGSRFWFERHSSLANPRHADGLRKDLVDEKPPAEVRLPGMTAEHRAAYEFNYMKTVEAQRQRLERDDFAPAREDQDSDWSRVRESLSHSGAELVALNEQYGNFQVTFRMDGRSYTSAVDKENLGLISSGICLDGRDQDFDLTSLVGVLREGIAIRQI